MMSTNTTDDIKYDFDTKALLKALLHCTKHPSCSVNGLFIGIKDSSTNTNAYFSFTFSLKCRCK